MGRLYYCDYCRRSFKDTLPTRTKHIRSKQHQLLRQDYYDQFKGEVAAQSQLVVEMSTMSDRLLNHHHPSWTIVVHNNLTVNLIADPLTRLEEEGHKLPCKWFQRGTWWVVIYNLIWLPITAQCSGRAYEMIPEKYHLIDKFIEPCRTDYYLNALLTDSRACYLVANLPLLYFQNAFKLWDRFLSSTMYHFSTPTNDSNLSH